jgi:RimJ/RimL family protein N-acetyltransferase
MKKSVAVVCTLHDAVCWKVCSLQLFRIFDVLTFRRFTLRMSYPPRVVLREVVDSELPIFFEHQRDPEAVRMAAFPSRDHDAFMTHWAKLRREPSNIIRTIVCDGQVVGNIGSWIAENKRLIGYWIGREFWGRGVATAALAAFVAEVKERPLHAFVAKHNVGSIRVLEKCDFVPSPEHDPSIAGEDGIHEILYMLSGRVV